LMEGRGWGEALKKERRKGERQQDFVLHPGLRVTNHRMIGES
jgi:hypothetical protein